MKKWTKLTMIGKQKVFRTKYKMKNFKEWKTSLTGLTINSICLYLVYTQKASFTEVAGFLMSGFSLFFVNDKIFK